MIRHLILIAALALGVIGAQAQSLAVLRTSILADPVLAPKCVPFGDGPFDIAAAYNLPAVPTFTVWRSLVAINEVGKAFNGSELAGLTTGNQTRLQTLALYLAAGVNPSIAGNRAFFDDVFSGAGGVNTRATLLTLWKRTATRYEKLFATGTGSDAVPATLVIEGTLSPSVVIQACS